MSCTAAEETMECTSTILYIPGKPSVSRSDSPLMFGSECTGPWVPSEVPLFSHHGHRVVRAGVRIDVGESNTRSADRRHFDRDPTPPCLNRRGEFLIVI